MLSAAISLCVVEWALRAVLHDEYFVWPPNLEATFHPSPEIFPGIEEPSHVKINASGMRGDPMPGGDALRILAVGGSTTECLYLDQAEAWPQALQARMNETLGAGRVWVGNVGRSGRNTRHHAFQVERLLDTHPQIDIVLVLAGVNDLTLRLSADQDPLPLDDEPAAYREKLMNEAFAMHQDSDASLPFYKRTSIWRMARQIRRNFVAPSNYFHYQSDTGAEYVQWRENRRRAERTRETLPNLTRALELYADDVRAIAAAAKSRGVRVVFLTQPSMWRADLPPELDALLWLGGVGQFHVGSSTEYYSPAALAEGMDRYNAALKRACEEVQAECIDLAAALPKDTSVFYDDVHFNESGARRVADVVAEHLSDLAPNSFQ